MAFVRSVHYQEVKTKNGIKLHFIYLPLFYRTKTFFYLHSFADLISNCCGLFLLLIGLVRFTDLILCLFLRREGRKEAP